MPPLDRPDPSRQFERDLAAISRRLRRRVILQTMTLAGPGGLLVTALIFNAGLPLAVAAVFGFAFASTISALRLALSRSSRSIWNAAAAARAIEAGYPGSRNVVITAEELTRHPERARPWVTVRVIEAAAEVTRQADPAAVVPLGASVLTVAGVSVLSLVAIGALSIGFRALSPRALDGGISDSAGPAAESLVITATITPPAYTREPRRTILNPARLDALRGSRLQLLLRGGSDWTVRFGTERISTTRIPEGVVADLGLEESGYVVIEGPRASPAPRLLPVAVTADRPPTIRIDAPGKDLLFPDARSSVAIGATATDDFGLQSLELRYTTASGTGEQFDFHEGSVPLRIDPTSARSWSARADLALGTLGLRSGDAIVYRVVGRDWRPGDDGAASSETFVIEVAGAGQPAVAGFEVPPDQGRYALSQQMIVLKLERLQSREPGLDPSVVETELGTIAAEQRAVRANFIFLTGGHVEDEEEEAEQSNEIQEGRLENTARREIVTAIRHMSRVEQALATASVANKSRTVAALPPARAAVEALQRAFGRSRYILRSLAVQSRIDSSRRLTGEISKASDWRRDEPQPAVDARRGAARALARRLLELTSGAVQPSVLTAMAEAALAVDPESPEWTAISRNLARLPDEQDPSVRSTLLNETLARVLTIAHEKAVTTQAPDRENSRLRSAWSEERRR